MKSTFSIPKDFSTLNRSFEILELLTTLSNYDPKKKVTLKLKKGVHEVIGEWVDQQFRGSQMLSVTCNTLSIVGEGQGKTMILGGFLVEHGESLSITGVTMKNLRGFGLVASGKIKVRDVTIEECQYNGITVRDGELDATECHFCQNESCGVSVGGSTTFARLTNCTSHHNKGEGVYVYGGAVVGLMGEGTSVHNNEGNGLCVYSRGSTINVYRPCVLGDVSHENKGQNINRGLNNRGTIQQKETIKRETFGRRLRAWFELKKMHWSQEGSEDEKVVKLMAKHGTQESYEIFLKNAVEEKWMKSTGLSTDALWMRR